jgi:hypothetical protein
MWAMTTLRFPSRGEESAHEIYLELDLVQPFGATSASWQSCGVTQPGSGEATWPAAFELVLGASLAGRFTIVRRALAPRLRDEIDCLSGTQPDHPPGGQRDFVIRSRVQNGALKLECFGDGLNRFRL